MPAFVGLFGIVLVAVGLYGVYQCLRVLSFVKTRGVVVSSCVGKERDDGDEAMYYPNIRFRHDVDGKTYDTGRYEIARITSSDKKAHVRIVRQYPIGRRITVWYDPTNPSTAVISRAFRLSFIALILGGVAVLGLALLLHREANFGS